MDENQLQQGDVILRRVNIDPTGKIIRDKRGIVLAEGEATGHYHGIAAAPGLTLVEQNGERFLVNETGKPVLLTHQEHHTVTVDPGVWQVGGVREFDYLQEMERKVVD